MKDFCTLSFTSTVNFPVFDKPELKPQKGTPFRAEPPGISYCRKPLIPPPWM